MRQHRIYVLYRTLTNVQPWQILDRGGAEFRKTFCCVKRDQKEKLNIKGPAINCKTIEDPIGPFRINTPAVNRKFVQKSRIEATTCHSTTYSTIQSVNHALLGFATLQSKCKN